MQNKREKIFNNPILSGFYPDPSVCKVDEDYYLVTSSFSYFPGIPIFHSKDLVHWQQIGHVLDRTSQLNLENMGHSRGIFAPTIRYHDGLFYVITTNVDGGGNFIVTADDPAGDWSDPYWIDNAPGIDPSLFFDDDGKAYYTGTRPSSNGVKYNGDWEIWLQEFNLEEMKLIGDSTKIWKGAMVDVIWPEGPHIYRINGYYYLMISEGGTGQEHAITIARSKKITGPYHGNPANPILTHRHLGIECPIVNVGHGDIVCTQNNEWWMVLLASRPYGGYYRNLGRETFLVPFKWENSWPIISPGSGKVEWKYNLPDLPEDNLPIDNCCDNFESEKLDYKWNTLRSPVKGAYSLSERPGFLRLYLGPEKITDLSTPSFIGRRQQDINFNAVTVMEFKPEKDKESAGIVLLQSNLYHYRFMRTLVDGKQVLLLIKCADGVEVILDSQSYNSEKIYIKVEARGQDYCFYYGDDLSDLQIFKESVDGRILSTDVAGGFVGTYIGMYASGNGDKSDNFADFDWFEYKGI